MQTRKFRPFAALLGLTLGLAILAASGPANAAGHSRAKTKVRHAKKAVYLAVSAPSTSPAAVPPAIVASQTTQAAQPTYEETVEYLKGRMGIGVVKFTVKRDDGKSEVMTKTYTYSFPESGVFVVVERIKDSIKENIDYETTETIPLKYIAPSSLKLYVDDVVRFMAVKSGHFSSLGGAVTNNLKLVQENWLAHSTGYNVNGPKSTFYTCLDQDMDEETQNKVLNALRHLVVLSGGKENSPDPFAKP